MQALYQTLVLKKDLSQKAKLSICQLVYVSILTNGHKLRVMTERIRSQMQAAKMSFLWRVL